MVQLISEVACRGNGSSGHRVIWAGLAVRNVKVLMTVIYCQPMIYNVLFSCSFAPCRAPASRVAVQALTALTLLWRERASARLARTRRGDVRHDPTSYHFRAFSCCHVIIEPCRSARHENETRALPQVADAHAEGLSQLLQLVVAVPARHRHRD